MEENTSQVLGLGVKKQKSTESLRTKNMMMAVYDQFDHDNHHRPFHGHDHHAGPTTNTALYRSNDIYDVGAAVRTTLQPFDSSSSSTYAAYKSPGGMAASLGFPFTHAQWKELERQSMIYKYMIASVPIPLDLLLPITRNFPAASASAVSRSPLGGGDFKLRFSNGTDPEPGRCKRTDGKKWRCSRDVAPGQKYCERHVHRGRPRSRKHVELQVDNNNTKRTRHDHHQPLPSSSSATLAHSHPTINNNTCQTQFFGYTPLPHNPSAFEPVTSRSLDWTMKEEPVSMAASDPRWLHLMQTRMDLTSKPSFCNTNSSVFTQQAEEEPFLNLNSYTNFNPGEDEQERDCSLFLNPDFVSLETQNQTQSQTPISFIDAWSKTTMEENKSCVSSIGGLSPSSLTLSMGGFGSNGEMGRSQLSSGSHFTNWLTPGGPLAEVLRPSSVSAATCGVSDPSSPFTVNGGDSGSPSPLATAVSSPSGVLQKTFGSMSDSSGCSSPKLRGSKAKAEIALF